jgi:hypothetical protein
MADLIELLQGPDGVRVLGALLQARGETLNSQARAILAKIEGIEATAPWGTDSTGQGITKFYLDPGRYPAPDSTGKVAANQALKDWLAANGVQVSAAGQALIEAIGYLSSAELENLLSMTQLPGSGG